MLLETHISQTIKIEKNKGNLLQRNYYDQKKQRIKSSATGAVPLLAPLIQGLDSKSRFKIY